MSYGVEQVVRDAGIVQALAEEDNPGRSTEHGNCPFCCALTEWGNEPEAHEPECPWRRAREAYPRAVKP